MKQRKIQLLKWLLFIILLGAAIFVALNRQWLYDFIRAKSYQPSSEMAKIRTSLDLTGRGEFLFDASWPELNTREEFNNYCRENDEEVAILGCYTRNNIYIYNITNAELDGIRELTTAHELLHAVYARMTDETKAALRPSLDKVYRDNINILKSDLDTYDETEKFEELYVRAGTEVKNLPDDLEKHYAEIFKDQDKVVSFYDKYIKVFRQLEEELDNLEREMKEIAKQVDVSTAEYEQQVEKLNSKINEFNRCTNTMGCFESEYVFNLRRSELMAEQDALDLSYEQINNLIDQYNDRVEKYNADVIQTEKLNEMINSSTKPKEL